MCVCSKAVLWSDSDHYLANVITGKAYLLLGKRGEAKLHYKKATTVQPQEQLAWKVKHFKCYNTKLCCV